MRTSTILISTTALGVLAGTASAQTAEVVWWAPNWGEERAEALAAQFEEANPDIDVVIEVTVPDGLQNRILVALRSGNPPDLIDVANGWNIPFAQTGDLAALDDIVSEHNINLEDFLPAALSTATLDGTLYGLPYRVEAHALIYNKQAYRDAGLDPEDPPETWDELRQYSEQLTTADGSQYGFGVAGGGPDQPSNGVFRTLPYMWMNGGGIISDDMETATVNSPETVEAVDFIAGLYADGYAPRSTLENDGLALRRLFIAGTIAQYQSGQFDLATIHAENPELEIGVAPIPHPAGAETAAILGGWNFVIPEGAANKEAAGKFLAFLSEPENMGYYTDTFPARVSAMELPRFNDPELEGFRAMLPHARPQPASPDWIRISQTYFDNFQEVLLGAEPQEAMDVAAEQIQELLSQQ